METLLSLSKEIGANIPFWVQGAGGNTSVKDQQNGVAFLWVKSSGLRLDDVVDANHFSQLPMQDVLSKLGRIKGSEDDNERAYADALKSSAMNASSSRRPSMETGFHIFLPKKFVLHFHSLPGLLMSHAASVDAPKINAWLKGHWNGGFEFVEACMPGWTLTNRLKDSGGASLLLLKNHGLILQSDDAAILSQWRTLERAFCRDWNYPLSPESASTPTPMRIYFPDTAVFLDRLRAVLESAGRSATGEPLFRLRAGAEQSDKDAAEIWKASALLYSACSELEQLPESISTRVAGLPTEQFRKSLHVGSAHGV
jgi:hypothetical protein